MRITNLTKPLILLRAELCSGKRSESQQKFRIASLKLTKPIHLIFFFILLASRVNIRTSILETKDDRTQVFFCGSGAVSKVVAKACATRGLFFVGAAVEK